jgi:hypothetical protein
MKNILEYIKEGITIRGNPEEGYEVFTIPTQHFRIKTLEELTPQKFKHQVDKQKKIMYET